MLKQCEVVGARCLALGVDNGNTLWYTKHRQPDKEDTGWLRLSMVSRSPRASNPDRYAQVSGRT